MLIWTQSQPSASLQHWGKLGGVGEMAWPEPVDSKNAVRRSGKHIREGNFEQEDIDVLNRWRAAHGYIINTFQATLRNRTRDRPVTVAQRLKRAATIVDKLWQGRALDLATMHDIAGVRLVLSNEEELRRFRGKSHKSRAKHELVNDIDRYDYIQNPKDSGYRGIHDVYRYHAGSVDGAKWNGLLIEIQYRTIVQHAWATAVELSDVLTANRTKFSQGTEDSARFFQICSELLARRFEDRTGCIADATHAQLVDEWREIESRVHIFQQLKSVWQQEGDGNIAGFALLVVQGTGDLRVERQKSYRDAIARLLALEAEHPDWDIVLVSGESEDLKSAFRNYFRNATEFVSLMESSL